MLAFVTTSDAARLRHDVRSALVAPLIRVQLLAQRLAAAPGLGDAERAAALAELAAVEAGLRRTAAAVGHGGDGVFAAWLRAEMAARGWTQAEVAEHAGVTPSAVGAWLAGRALPRPEARARLVAALEVPEAEVPV